MRIWTFALLVGVALIFETLSAAQALYTSGPVVTMAMAVAIAFNLAAIALYAAGRRPMAFGVVLLLAVTLVPYQAHLASRWRAIKSESTQIIAYAEQVHAESGVYPADLSNYEYSDPALARYFHFHVPYRAQDEFVLSFYIGSPDTTHMYYASSDSWTLLPN